MQIKTVSIWSLRCQIILLILLLAYFFSIFAIGAAGGGSYLKIQQAWLLIYHAPLIVLPFLIVFTMAMRKVENYRSSVFVPLICFVLTVAASQAYVRLAPEPIKRELGERDAPYKGFLYLPVDTIPQGFHETKHHYSKVEYLTSYSQSLDGEKIDLDIVEGKIVNFMHNNEQSIQKFKYNNIEGQIYNYHNTKTGQDTLSLTWENPPVQRISIYLSQPKASPYKPEYLIDILKSMKVSETTPDLSQH